MSSHNGGKGSADFYVQNYPEKKRRRRKRNLLIKLLHHHITRRTRLLTLILMSSLRKERTIWSLYRQEFWFTDMINNTYDLQNIKNRPRDFRMGVKAFEKLVQLVRPRLERRDTQFRRAIPIEKHGRSHYGGYQQAIRTERSPRRLQSVYRHHKQLRESSAWN